MLNVEEPRQVPNYRQNNTEGTGNCSGTRCEEAQPMPSFVAGLRIRNAIGRNVSQRSGELYAMRVAFRDGGEILLGGH